jgi:predicted MFS family arabinose efflux permease
MNPWRGLGALPREVWILFAATLVNRAGTMALPFLVLYLTKALGFAPGEAGLVLACYGGGALLTGPLAGKLSDAAGPLRVMRGSFVLTGLILLAFPFAKSFSLIIGATICWAVVSEAFRPASLALISEVVLDQRKAAFALNRLAINLGMSIGPALGGFLFLISYPVLFFVNGATTILAALLLIIAPWPVRDADTQANAHKDQGILPEGAPRRAIHDKRLLCFLGAILPVFIVFFQHEGALPLFLVRDLHLPESTYGLMFTVNTALIVIFEIPLNIATAHRPHRQMLAIGSLFVGTGFGSMMFATSFITVAASVAVWTVGEMIVLPGAAAYMADIAPSDRRGEYMGLYQMMTSLSLAVSAWLGTALLEQFGATLLWSATFGAGCASALLLSRIRVPAATELPATISVS